MGPNELVILSKQRCLVITFISKGLWGGSLPTEGQVAVSRSIQAWETATAVDTDGSWVQRTSSVCKTLSKRLIICQFAVPACSMASCFVSTLLENERFQWKMKNYPLFWFSVWTSSTSLQIEGYILVLCLIKPENQNLVKVPGRLV
jgi:hypothetical protein